MKVLGKYILMASCSFGCFSCEDFFQENPTSYYNENDIFVSPEKAEMAVLGVYSSLADMYAEREMAFSSGEDQYYIRGTETDNGRSDVSHYMLTPANTYIEGEWNCIYNGLNKANFTIEKIESMPDYEQNKKLISLVAETKFLRALFSYNLVRYWGDVPYKISSSTGINDTFIGRTDRNKIYDQIELDLDFAKNNLEWASDIGTSERASQGAARALLMRVELQRAGYSLGHDGKMSRPDEEFCKSCYEKVIEEWNAFNDNGSHGFYKGTDERVPDIEEFFRCFSSGKVDIRESIFEVAYSSSSDGVGSQWGVYMGVLVGHPESGLPESIEAQTMKYTQAFYRVVPEWKDFFEETDERLPLTICDFSWSWNNKADMFEKKTLSATRDWTPGKWRRDWQPIIYSKQNNGTNFCYLRYADVVLMAAEAYNELDNTLNAWKLLNSVRKRSNATPVDDTNYSKYYKAPKVYDFDHDEKGKFRTALFWERGFELAFEGQRKYDLLRWGVLYETIMQSWNNTELDKNSNYAVGKNFKTGKHELMPIPMNELLINVKLNGINNPGY